MASRVINVGFARRYNNKELDKIDYIHKHT